jgi:hypothetical protein
MLVIAHPGNEAMFFAPFITALLKTKSAGQAGFLQQKTSARPHGTTSAPGLHICICPAGFVSALSPVLLFCLFAAKAPLAHVSSSGNCQY